MNSTIATINNPSKWVDSYTVTAVDGIGKTLDFVRFDTRKAAMKFITDHNYTFMTNKAYAQETGYRAHIAHGQNDIHYNYASNG